MLEMLKSLLDVEPISHLSVEPICGLKLICLLNLFVCRTLSGWNDYDWDGYFYLRVLPALGQVRVWEQHETQGECMGMGLGKNIGTGAV